MNVIEYGFDNSKYQLEEVNKVARIISVHRDRYEITCNKGTGFATLKSSKFYENPDSIYPTIGDFVLIDWNERGESRINGTLKRISQFSRLDPSPDRMHEQVIAANFDYVFIMQSLNSNFNLRRLERYLTLAWQSGATPIIILTKADLENNVLSKVLEVEEFAIGIDVIAISIKTGEGIDRIKKYFSPRKTIVFLGSSGVGKSTLVNYLAGNEVMTTNEIREDDDRGRHTTTSRQIIMLPNGAMIIDTPGMRELGMWKADEGLEKTFEDVESYIGMCKYSDCTHTNEPGCAIQDAIKHGELSQERFDSYIKLKNEAKYIENSSSYLQEKKQKFKEIAKQNKINGKRK